ncbi:MAG: hypothetical protein ACK4UJ_07890 [Leptonema sp. (in: bacteria)]
MIRPIESIKVTGKKSHSKKWILFIFAIFFLIFLGYIAYPYKDWFILQIRKIFLPENIKFAESKFTSIRKELEEEIIKSNNFYQDINKRENYLKKIEENIHLFYFFEKSSENLQDLYYFLSLSYFFKIITYYNFTKENLLIQISRGVLPDSLISKQDLQLREGKLITQKYIAINRNYENNPNFLISLITIHFYDTNILSKYLYKMINKVQNTSSLEPVFRPYYEWFYLVINSNYGNVESINLFLRQNLFWEFSEEEKLLIQGITYYYAKDYYNFLRIFYDYKNKIIQPYENLNKMQKLVYREFLRLALETYFLQGNFLLANYIFRELEILLKKEMDEFIQNRIEILLKKKK